MRGHLTSMTTFQMVKAEVLLQKAVTDLEISGDQLVHKMGSKKQKLKINIQQSLMHKRNKLVHHQNLEMPFDLKSVLILEPIFMVISLNYSVKFHNNF